MGGAAEKKTSDGSDASEGNPTESRFLIRTECAPLEILPSQWSALVEK